MTKTYCDVCGVEMTEGIFAADPRTNEGMEMEGLTDVYDVCKRCHLYGTRMRPRKLLLDIWRQSVGAAIEKEDTDG